MQNLIKKHLKNKIMKSEHKKEPWTELEICVNCGCNTPYIKETNIEFRNFYVEGAGQLCCDCYKGIYND